MIVQLTWRYYEREDRTSFTFAFDNPVHARSRLFLGPRSVRGRVAANRGEKEPAPPTHRAEFL